MRFAGERDRVRHSFRLRIDGQDQRSPVGSDAHAADFEVEPGRGQLRGDGGIAWPEGLEAVASRGVFAIGDVDPLRQAPELDGIDGPVEGDGTSRGDSAQASVGCGAEGSA